MSSPPPPTAAASSTVHDLQDQLSNLTEQINHEKAGKRKLFHSLVKLADELRTEKQISSTLADQAAYLNRNWYDGGLWRAPQVLPSVASSEYQQELSSSSNSNNAPNAFLQGGPLQALQSSKQRTATRTNAAISLSDLFFSLVIVTAFTRVGVAVSQQGLLSIDSLLYFALFWQVWNKETNYSTRFDTSDLSAQLTTLATCFMVLFASLSVQAPITSVDGTRVMIMAAGIAVLHCALHLRVLYTIWPQAKGRFTEASLRTSTTNTTTTTTTTTPLEQLKLSKHIRAYALYNVVMNILEAAVWIVGVFYFPQEFEYRWVIFTAGVVLALRVPRVFLANDFHGACCCCCCVGLCIVRSR
jgi:hypothetical protein